MGKLLTNLFIVFIAILAGCSGGVEKKVLVMASGKIDVQGNTVNFQPSSQHNEVEVGVTGDKLTVASPSGSSDFPVPENGLYILNLKKDTLVGSYQRLGTDNSQQVISQENLKSRIDSLNQLMVGSNTNAANRNFNIPPNQLSKITANTNAQIVGPYKKMPASFEAGKEHEIYKFYTNKEMQEIINKLKPMVEAAPVNDSQ